MTLTVKSMLLFCLVILHCVSKNVPHLTCYNLDEHNPITIIFGTNVTENVDKKASIR